MFFVWSGIKINRGKTCLSIFGAILVCPRFVQTLRIKWSTESQLLGLNFNQYLTNMDQNYQDCFEKVKKELNSWRHRFLTVFGKITVIKNMCIPKFTHIATVIPNLSICQIKDIEREFEFFFYENNPLVTDKTTSNWSKTELAKNKMDNLVWKEVYSSLLACRRNLVKASPSEYLSLPVNREPYIYTHHGALISQ